MRKLKIATTLVLALTLSCCHEGVCYHHFQNIPKEGWSHRDTLSFPLGLDSLAPYRKIWIEARIECDYPYSTLPLIVEQRAAGGHIEDSVTLLLSDDSTRLTGKGLRLLQYRQGPFAIESATTEIRLRHAAGTVKLLGIKEVGIETEIAAAKGESRVFKPLPARVYPKKYKKKKSETPEAAASITEERQGNTNHRSEPQNHTDVDKHVEKEYTEDTIAVDTSITFDLPLRQSDETENQSQKEQ